MAAASTAPAAPAAAASSSSKPHVVFGTMTFGTGFGGRISDLATMREILDLVRAHGHYEVQCCMGRSIDDYYLAQLDTARMYCGGNTEEVLAQLGVTNSDYFHIHTKAWPVSPGDHAPEKLKEQFRTSLKALKTKKVKIFYLHAPDYATPFEQTLAAVDELYRQGTFDEFGLSNYSAWNVMQIHWICKTKGYVLPTVYQGMYNALTRDVEKELLPCLRELGIRFYAYNPLCGGLLSGNFNFDSDVAAGGRFDPKTAQGAIYRQRFWHHEYFSAIAALRAIADAHAIPLARVAVRWLFHHSLLTATEGGADAVLIGASSVTHARDNLLACEEGPLPEEIVKALDDAYQKTRGAQVSYFKWTTAVKSDRPKAPAE
ncbi:Aldo/keto reductase [Zopfochytrium polystomum]|nr:Aldo/keto reductase [Zopfochytrium polystomum]